MAGGLAALLDDVAMIAKMASAAGSKAIGVVVDDAAVTPRYVHGFEPARELPIIWRIARGSLVNKAIIIVALLVLSEYANWLLTPILMLGGAYLSFEGAEKVWEFLTGKHQQTTEQGAPVLDSAKEREDKMVRGAITTDFILSAEIMMISLNEIRVQPLLGRGITLVIVAIGITALVYGVVALIVKMDDLGVHLLNREKAAQQRLGKFLVNSMPRLLTALSVIGVLAMMWVGGHILLAGAETLGWAAPMQLVHAVSGSVSEVALVGGVIAWLVDALLAAMVAFALGSVLAGIVALLPLHRKDVHAPAES